ncbi:hypothetical protein D9613_009744 [Agrocybe pediades]|uniref:Uncharacterized protein n=1 Tax=Agrocybe pediades TaxID=84607 RepID=A0A8H4QWG8_9AGAR|nr:hypothetical protein D9613_009744 [Agrocybe pediades]
MSSPIAIPRSPKATSYAAAAASPGSSSVMSVSMDSPRSSGVYVPLHKRTPSSPSSPTRALPTASNDVSSTAAAAPHPLIYSPSFLLSLRSVPLSTSETTIMKSKIRETSPEVADKVVMNRRMRKGLEFKGPKKPSAKAAKATPTTPNSATAPLPQKAAEPAPAATQPTTTPVQAKRSRPTAVRRTRSSTARPRRQIILRTTRGAAARAIGMRESWRSSTDGVSQAVAVA